MNVLSLFDGMGCGYLALERAGIPIDNYYASEIDKYAIHVCDDNNFGIHRLGDVTGVSHRDLPEIDLLIGGSPCQGFSFAGKQLNFSDPHSALFFEFVRLLGECTPKYFLLENVMMKQEHQDVISHMLDVQPIKINSALVSAQNRKRLYWTNIPNVTQPEDRGILLADILDDEVGERYYAGKCLRDGYSGGDQLNPNYKSQSNTIHRSGKAPVICAGTHGYSNGYVGAGCIQVGKATDIKGTDKMLRVYSDKGKSPCVDTQSGGNRHIKVSCGGYRYRKLTPVECERLQTVPDGYTSSVSNTQRYKMLGNGWTVDVLAHVFKGLKNG